MKSIKPTILSLVPAPPITINLADGVVFGISDSAQLEVTLDLMGESPATAIVSLVILSPQLYLFDDGTKKKQYIISMNRHQMNALLEFKLKNLAYFPSSQPTFDVGIYTWEQSTGESIKRSDFAHIDVVVERPTELKFKKLSK